LGPLLLRTCATRREFVTTVMLVCPVSSLLLLGRKGGLVIKEGFVILDRCREHATMDSTDLASLLQFGQISSHRGRRNSEESDQLFNPQNILVLQKRNDLLEAYFR
jgi:hypothetical protein